MNVQPEPVFFTDRDLGKQFPTVLAQAGIHVEQHAEHFAPDTKDEEWLAIVGQRGWYVLTHDRRIRYKPNEIAAVRTFGIGLFVVVGKAPFAELADNFVATVHKVIRFIHNIPRPFIAKIYRAEQRQRKARSDAGGYVKLWVSF